MIQASQKSEHSTKQSSHEDDKKTNDKVITIPIADNLQKSIPLMTQEQIVSNLLEINLVSIYNEIILNKLYEWSLENKFYLMNRYLLESVINVGHHLVTEPKNKQANKHKKQLSEIVEKYDTIYVNGRSNSQARNSKIIKTGLQKQVRAKFIGDREQFVYKLEQLSSTLKKYEKQLSQEELRQLFENSLEQLNESVISTSVCPQKVEEIKNYSASSFDSNDSGISEVSSVNSFDAQLNKIFIMHFQGQVRWVHQVNPSTSKFIRTKNRYPLLLDFGFARFIYKNDDQLSHEIIAMHLAKYFNKIVSQKMGKPQIIEYEIIPEASGAFYEFVEDSMTIGQIKRTYGTISQYLDHLQAKSDENSHTKISSIRKRFAETFAGFCTLQYFLQLKDRNNQNIMIRSDGSIFHIDLAFIFNATPGGINFESAPFKFTTDYYEAMGGDFDSDTFKYYQSLMIANFSKILMNKCEILYKLSILCSRKQQISCFKKFKLEQFSQKIPYKHSKVVETIQALIDQSYDNWRTNRYDKYQFDNNNIPM